MQQVRTRYDLLSARQFGELANEADVRQKQPPRYSPDTLAALGTGTDWQREVLRTASTQEHHLSWLNTLNLWASYGRTSNAGNFFDLCQLFPPPVLGSMTSPLPVLERVTQLETGLSVQLWQHFSAQATVYQRQTTPNSPILRAFGIAPPDYRVRNRGLELSAAAAWASPEWRACGPVSETQQVFGSTANPPGFSGVINRGRGSYL